MNNEESPDLDSALAAIDEIVQLERTRCANVLKDILGMLLNGAGPDDRGIRRFFQVLEKIETGAVSIGYHKHIDWELEKKIRISKELIPLKDFIKLANERKNKLEKEIEKIKEELPDL